MGTEQRTAFWELFLGTKGLVWAGVGLFFLGLVSLLVYGCSEGWFTFMKNPSLRVSVIGAIGLGMIGTGWFFRQRTMRALGEGLAGGGLAVLYLVVLGAIKPGLLLLDQPLISPTLGFLGMALVAAGGVALAVRWNALPTAILALLGGLAAPLLASTGQGQRDALCTYLMLLDLGVLASAIFRRWRTLDLLAFAGTALLFGGWYCKYYYPGIQVGTLLWLAGFHLVFLLVPFIHHWWHRTTIPAERFALALANLAWSLGYSAWIVGTGRSTGLSLACLVLAGLYLGLGQATRLRVPQDHRMIHGFRALATMLLVLGTFYLLPVNGLSVAWFVESALLLWVGYHYDYRPTRWGAWAVLGLAMLRLLICHVPWPAIPAQGALPAFFNIWFLMLGLPVLTLAAFHVIYRWWGATGWEARLSQGCAFAAALFLPLIASWELLRVHDQLPGRFWNILPIASALALVWTLTATGFLGFAAWRRHSATAHAGLPALAIALLAGLLSYGATAMVPWFPGCSWRALVLGAAAVVCLSWRAMALRCRLAGTWSHLLPIMGQTILILIATFESLQWSTWHIQAGIIMPQTRPLILIWTWLTTAAISLGWTALPGLDPADRQRIRRLALLPLTLAAGGVIHYYRSIILGPSTQVPSHILINAIFPAGALTIAGLWLVVWQESRINHGLERIHLLLVWILSTILLMAESWCWCLHLQQPMPWRLWSLGAAVLTTTTLGLLPAVRLRILPFLNLAPSAVWVLTLVLYLCEWPQPGWPVLNPRFLLGIWAVGLAGAWMLSIQCQPSGPVRIWLMATLLFMVEGLSSQSGHPELALWACAVGLLLGIIGGLVYSWNQPRRPLLPALATASTLLAILCACLYEYVWDRPWWPVLNQRCLLSLASLGGMAALAWLAHRSNPRSRLPSLLGWIGLASGLLVITAEPWAWCLDLRARAFAITASWLLTASTLLTTGFVIRLRRLRLLALGLLTLTIIKLLFFDLNADGIYRIAAFMIAGLVFIAASWLYHHWEQKLDPRTPRHDGNNH